MQKNIYKPFVERLADKVRALRVGDPESADTHQGALVSQEQLEKVERYVAIAKDEGGTIEVGGKRPTELPARCKDGYFYEPTLITGLDQSSRVNREEIFGPVATVMPFDDVEDAVRIANDVKYGLASSIWTNDLGKAHHVAERIESGIVWVNCWMDRDLRVPFGGVKQSGVGREGGQDALRFFTEPKNVCFAYPSSLAEKPS